MSKISASVLAFSRCLSPSDARLSSCSWERRQGYVGAPVLVREKTIRGTISNRLRSTVHEDPVKLNAEVRKPNIQTVDVAALPLQHDTLVVRFNLRVLGGVGIPTACNNVEYKDVLSRLVDAYKSADQMTTLGWRYAQNLANGRWLWRNAYGADAIEVKVQKIALIGEGRSWVFAAPDVSLRDFDAPAEDVKSLGDDMAEALVGDASHLYAVTAYVHMGGGAEVYPSQCMTPSKGSDKIAKSKTLHTSDGMAGMTSQKIGNAIRTVDTWHASAAEVGPIAVEVYGSVTSMGAAYRSRKASFFSILDRWVGGKDVTVDEQHYAMACLLRGGVYGGKSE